MALLPRNLVRLQPPRLSAFGYWALSQPSGVNLQGAELWCSVIVSVTVRRAMLAKKVKLHGLDATAWNRTDAQKVLIPMSIPHVSPEFVAPRKSVLIFPGARNHRTRELSLLVCRHVTVKLVATLEGAFVPTAGNSTTKLGVVVLLLASVLHQQIVTKVLMSCLTWFSGV